MEKRVVSQAQEPFFGLRSWLKPKQQEAWAGPFRGHQQQLKRKRYEHFEKDAGAKQNMAQIGRVVIGSSILHLSSTHHAPPHH